MTKRMSGRGQGDFDTVCCEGNGGSPLTYMACSTHARKVFVYPATSLECRQRMDSNGDWLLLCDQSKLISNP